MAALIEVCHRFPSLPVIVNHGGFPPAAELNYSSWKASMMALASCPNVAVKASGWEMTNRYWRPESAGLVIKDLISLFGNERVMLASNFPLSNWRYSYSEFWDLMSGLVENSELERLTYLNARHWYGFSHQ